MSPRRPLSRRSFVLGGLAQLAACGSSTSSTSSTSPTATSPTTAAPRSTTAAPTAAVTTVAPPTSAASTRTLHIGAIPDAAPEKLQQTNQAMATYLGHVLGVKVEYVPVNDYAAAVTQFRNGDLDLVWFGGLTGVQARLQTPGATVLAQRDIDDAFHSVFIVNASTGIAPLAAVGDLTKLKGLRFTFGSESSTSGRLMPEFFLDQAGIDARTDFAGAPGYSGSHVKTLDLVAAGTFQAGVLNEQVWKRRAADGSVDTTKVVEVLRTPAYRDYHWIAGPDTDRRFGAGFTAKIRTVLLNAASDPDGTKVLGLLGGKAFIATSPANYTEIEAIGRKLGLIA